MKYIPIFTDLEDAEVQGPARVGAVLAHRVGDVAGLVADRLERRAGHVRVGVEARQPDDRPARIGWRVLG